MSNINEILRKRKSSIQTPCILSGVNKIEVRFYIVGTMPTETSKSKGSGFPFHDYHKRTNQDDNSLLQ